MGRKKKTKNKLKDIDFIKLTVLVVLFGIVILAVLSPQSLSEIESTFGIKISNIIDYEASLEKSNVYENVVDVETVEATELVIHEDKLNIFFLDVGQADSSLIIYNDKTMLIEIAPGLGENIVSGQNKPEQYYYDWFNEKCIFDEANSFINEKMLKKIGLEFSKIMLYFGYPCDIEFAIVKNKLYILQARKITKIEYQGFEDLWTTADFKDGGVSASVCTPYMWSLYEYIWEYTLRKFILDSKILRKSEFPKKVGEMFYSR